MTRKEYKDMIMLEIGRFRPGLKYPEKWLNHKIDFWRREVNRIATAVWTEATITTTAGTQTYSLPSTLEQGAEYIYRYGRYDDEYQIEKVNIGDIIDFDPSDTGTPRYFAVRPPGTVYLLWTPDTDDKVITLLGVKRIPALTDETTSDPDLPDGLQEAVVKFVVSDILLREGDARSTIYRQQAEEITYRWATENITREYIERSWRW